MLCGAHHARAPFQVPPAPLLNKLHANTQRKAEEDDPGTQTTMNCLEDTERVPGSDFSQHLAFAVIWRLNGRFSFSLFLFLPPFLFNSVFQIYKSFKIHTNSKGDYKHMWKKKTTATMFCEILAQLFSNSELVKSIMAS